MTYQETIEYLYTRLPMYQRIGKAAYKKDLTNTLALLEELDNPHLKFKSVHIAGTNGKGTSAHGMASILQKAGYKVGLYTSPHLKSFTERIRINGLEIEEYKVVSFVERIKEAIERIQPSFFEITVAMAFDLFVNESIDIAVVETGLGGRLDSTNVINPEVCLITNIGYDHMDMLGDTLEKIAREKAGIIKNRIPVIIGTKQEETTNVFLETANSNNAPITFAPPTTVPLTDRSPDYLSKNIPGILSAIDVLRAQGWNISDQDIKEGLRQMNTLTGLKGRFQILEEQPLVIADVSHNFDGLKVLFQQIQRINKGRLLLIFGSVKEKDLKPILDLIPQDAQIYWTTSSVPRALSVEELAIQGVMIGLQGQCFRNVNEAIEEAKKNAADKDLILITGSTFVIAEIDML